MPIVAMKAAWCPLSEGARTRAVRGGAVILDAEPERIRLLSTQARLGANRMRCAYLGLKRIRQVEKASAESRVLKRIMESLTSGIRGTSLTIVTDHGNANLSTEARAFSRNTR